MDNFAHGITSTGHTNATGGKGFGLECDKFNPEAIRLQFNSWFGKACEIAEKILYDLRQTIEELVTDIFYKILQQKAHAKGCLFSAESTAPTMLSDGIAHYRYTDIPMGEFWLQSPTHDKPNDVADAVSGAHIYGKNIVQAEAFTQLRNAFTEYPAMLKTLQDRNYAQGINRLVFQTIK